MSIRSAFIALSLISNLALIVATVLAFAFYPTADGGIIVGAFCLTSLTVSTAVLSLHFKSDD